MTFREMLVEDLEQVVDIEQNLFSVPWTKEGFLTYLMKKDTKMCIRDSRKLGLRPEKIHSVIRKQLLIYYMTPFVVSAVISWIIVKYISDSFVFYTQFKSF